MSDHIITATTVRPCGGQPAIPDGAVLVRDASIVAVGSPGLVLKHASPSVKHTDLPGCTIMPGLIDGAVRLSLSGSATPYDDLPQDQLAGTLGERVASNGLHTLLSGVTTVRDVGEADNAVLHYRRQISDGRAIGPRVLCSGAPLTIPDGDGAILGGAVTGTTAIRTAIRDRADSGADFLTYHDSGGYFPGRWHRQGWTTHFTPQQCQLIVDEAHHCGLQVSAHTYSADGARNAINAGADVIDHLVWMRAPDQFARDETAAADMHRRGIIACLPSAANRQHMIAKHGERAAFERWYSRYTWLDTHGVELLIASNAGVTTSVFGDYVSTLETYEWLGFGDRTLEIATSVAARALGLRTVGTLATGMTADLIAVRGDPATDLQALRSMELVMVAGRTVT